MTRIEDSVTNWITAQEAARLLTERSGHTVSSAYVRKLGNELAKIETWQVDSRTKLYSRKDIMRYSVRKAGDGSVRRALRKTRKSEAQV
jgi:hypothetical protein